MNATEITAYVVLPAACLDGDSAEFDAAWASARRNLNDVLQAKADALGLVVLDAPRKGRVLRDSECAYLFPDLGADDIADMVVLQVLAYAAPEHEVAS